MAYGGSFEFGDEWEKISVQAPNVAVNKHCKQTFRKMNSYSYQSTKL